MPATVATSNKVFALIDVLLFIPDTPVAPWSGLRAESCLAAPSGSRKGPRHQYMSPPPPIPGGPFSPLASGISQMMASVVSSSDAMDAAFCKA